MSHPVLLKCFVSARLISLLLEAVRYWWKWVPVNMIPMWIFEVTAVGRMDCLPSFLHIVSPCVNKSHERPDACTCHFGGIHLFSVGEKKCFYFSICVHRAMNYENGDNILFNNILLCMHNFTYVSLHDFFLICSLISDNFFFPWEKKVNNKWT